MKKPVTEELAVWRRGLVDCIDEAELAEKIERARKKKTPLRVKYGADPSSPHLHLGHTVPLRKLKAIQELGHVIIFLIGDFTARIGDPSHQTATRKMISREDIKQNAQTYQEQVFRILDRKRTKVVYNAAWLDRFRPEDFLNLMSQYTIARLLERDDFSQRFAAKKPITLLEFMYPLLQGYDSVELKSDVELGGTDQKFNLLVGRELQRAAGQEPQVVLTLPIIEGTDGVRKMSKSFGNAIGLDDTPENMFGGVMSIPDALMVRYLKYLTDADEAAVQTFEKDLASGKLHPRQAKVCLAKELVELYFSSADAERAEAAFDRVFKAGKPPEDMPEITVSARRMPLLNLLEEAKLIESRAAGRRLIQQGAVEIDGVSERAYDAEIALDRPRTIRCGKRKFARVRSGK